MIHVDSLRITTAERMLALLHPLVQSSASAGCPEGGEEGREREQRESMQTHVD